MKIIEPYEIEELTNDSKSYRYKYEDYIITHTKGLISQTGISHISIFRDNKFIHNDINRGLYMNIDFIVDKLKINMF